MGEGDKLQRTRFEIGETDFLLDGEPYRIISGALHYFRVHPEQWRDRIRKARLMGLNTIETYVAWNEHSPEPGIFDTSERLDLARFLQEIHAEGMHAIVRPGPYICAEFDGGGLPAWLFRDPSVGIRTLEPTYMAAVSEYLAQVMSIVAPLQIDQGGPVILMQVENEYGAYGSNHDYLRALTNLFRERGVTVPLTTVDNPEPEMLAAGNIPGLLATGSFGTRSAERLDTLRAYQPAGPVMCSEFWCGWFDHWGAEHHTTDASTAAAELETMLAQGASVNIYMFHGGTNFGLTSGANDKSIFQPTVTSYDYDAPLDEAGNPTAKFWAFREAISRYAEVPAVVDLPETAFVVPPPAELRRVGSLDALTTDASWHAFDTLPTMDDIGVARGFVRYRANLRGEKGPAVLAFGEVRDRAWVRLNGQPVGTLAREQRERAITLPSGEGVLEILVEDEGRVNYGPRIGEPKGLVGQGTLDGHPICDWEIVAVPLDAVPLVTAGGASDGGAAVWRAEFDLDEPTDLAVMTEGLGKGLLWIGEFCLGRYWRAGPQRSLYIPSPVTHAGTNVLTVLELETLTATELRFSRRLELGPTEA